jgi:hypothetical protein
MNKILTLLNDNKWNKDSLDAVHVYGDTLVVGVDTLIFGQTVTISGDTIFVTWLGETDTLVASGVNYWTKDRSENIVNNNDGKVTIDSLYLYPIPPEASPRAIGRVLGVETNGQIKWSHWMTIYREQQDSLRQLAEAGQAPPELTWVRDTTRHYVYLADTSDFVGIGTTNPVYNFDLRGSSGFFNGLAHFGLTPGNDMITIDPVGIDVGHPVFASIMDSNYFGGAVVMDSSLNVNDVFRAVHNSTYLGYDPMQYGMKIMELAVENNDTTAEIYTYQSGSAYVAEMKCYSPMYTGAVLTLTNQKGSEPDIHLLSANYHTGKTTDMYVTPSYVSISSVLYLSPISAAPSPAYEGMVYYDSDDHKLKVYNGSTWDNLN